MRICKIVSVNWKSKRDDGLTIIEIVNCLIILIIVFVINYYNLINFVDGVVVHKLNLITFISIFRPLF